MDTDVPLRSESRRRWLLGSAAVPVAAIGLAALNTPTASATDPDHSPEVRGIAEIRAADPAIPPPAYLVNDPGQEGCYLLDPGDTTSADDTGLVLVDAGGRRYRRTVTTAIDVRWFGATGDTTTDDTTAIRAAVAGVAGILGERPTLAFGPADGYRTTDTVTVPVDVDVIMHAPLLYAGPADQAALDIGAHNQVNARRELRLDVQRPIGTGYADWSTEDHIGIVLRNLDTSWVHVVAAVGFTIGVQCYGDSAGFAYTTVELGQLVANRIALDLTNRDGGDGVGWTNENLFLGGRFATYSTLNQGQSRYGVRIRSTDGTYTNNNNNLFLKPSFELNQAVSAPGEALPILIEAGSLNCFESVRNESNGSVLMRVLGDSSRNVVEAGYGQAAVDDQSLHPSSLARARGDLGQVPVTIFQSGSLAERACYYDGATRLHLPGLSFCVRADGSSSVAGRAVRGADHLEVSASSHDAPGVVVDTTSSKRFVVKSDNVPGYGGRLFLVCLDASGAVVPDPGTGAAAALVKTLPSATVYWNASAFGGSYQTGSDADQRSFYFQVDPAVAAVRVMFWRGTAALRLRSFTIQALDKASPTVTSGCGHPNDQRIATSCPSAGQWPRGMTLHHAAPTTAGSPEPYLVAGWTKITDAATNVLGTDWVELRLPVAP